MDQILRDAIRLLATNPDLIPDFQTSLRKTIIDITPKQEVVINTRFGGFDLPEVAIRWLRDNGYVGETYLPGEHYPDGEESSTAHAPNIERHDPLLVSCVKHFKKHSPQEVSDLEIVTIPKLPYHLSNYDGIETVHW